MKYVLFCIIVIVEVIVDLYTKNKAINGSRRIVYNKGAFIGLLKNRKKLLSILQMFSIFILIFLLLYCSLFPIQVSLAIIIGGSLGNIYEHIFKGQVTDFIKIKKLYINLADIFIFIGLLLFVYNLIR